MKNHTLSLNDLEGFDAETILAAHCNCTGPEANRVHKRLVMITELDMTNWNEPVANVKYKVWDFTEDDDVNQLMIWTEDLMEAIEAYNRL